MTMKVIKKALHTNAVRLHAEISHCKMMYTKRREVWRQSASGKAYLNKINKLETALLNIRSALNILEDVT